MAYVNLKKMPTPKREYVASFDNLDGGLDLHHLDYRIKNDESPEMQNLWWDNGVLSSRPGQVWIDPEEGEEFHAAYNRLWRGKAFRHSGNMLYVVDPETGEKEAFYTGGYDFTERGTFFLYNNKLYYKTRGYYIEIDADETSFFASDVEGYTPVTYINCSPLNGSGTPYQPENRISANKTLWYNALYTLNVTCSQPDLALSVENSYFRMRISTPGVYEFSYNSGWFLNGVEVNPLDYGINIAGVPETDAKITVVYTFVNEYYLPVTDVNVTSIVVDNVEQKKEELGYSSSDAIDVSIDSAVWRSGDNDSGVYRFVYDYDALPAAGWKLDDTLVDLNEYGITYTADQGSVTGDYIEVDYIHGDYWIDEDRGVVIFFEAPRVYYPEINNTVRITYSKENEIAYNNIMDCTIVEVYGGTGALCIIMAGSETQPNAYFWNGQTSVSVDPSYFPMTQYQLAGDMSDPITGFGKQQGFLIIFKKESIGRTTLSTQEIDGRTTIDLAYVSINAKIGCDLPYTIQLIENNLTWCNTTSGVHFLANTSSAYENNVECISQKINESSENWNLGLLNDIRQNDVQSIVSHDDEKRYWLVTGDHVWLWDYELSNYKHPAWFYFTDIRARAFIQEDNVIWHFDSKSRMTKFRKIFYDYDAKKGAINKVYRFATQYFGTYDNLKNVNSVVINMRSDTNSETELEYSSDYETRKDLTPLEEKSWKLVPRDLSFRNLKGRGFAYAFRRKPHCRRVQYFTMKLTNNIAGMDMTVVSAQIYYVFEGRQR